MPPTDDTLAAPQTGARSLLLTMLGEFALPADGAVWTSTIVEGLATVGIAERNARQAAARLGDQGVVRPDRVGRRTRWHLTDDGRRLLATGATRIYSFGRRADGWDGSWLLVNCSIPESQRGARNRFRTRLTFEGFGFLTPTIAISPHCDREQAANEIITDLGLRDTAVTFVARTGEITDDGALLATAWDLDELALRYTSFIESFDRRAAAAHDGGASFGAVLELVDAWRRFPFADPELPTELLPDGWIGSRAHEVFDRIRARHTRAATAWFTSTEASAAAQ